MPLIRSFIATDFDAAPFRDVLAKLGEMGRPVKTVPEPLHLTLKFLGDVDPEMVEQISQIIGEVASLHEAMQVELTGLGAFPRPERPSVIWAGLSPAQPLQALAADLESLLQPLGFPPEQRSFQPHLTLARVKARPPRELHDLLDQHREDHFGQASVHQITLYQSRLTPDGPHYSPLSTHPLATHPHLSMPSEG